MQKEHNKEGMEASKELQTNTGTDSLSSDTSVGTDTSAERQPQTSDETVSSEHEEAASSVVKKNTILGFLAGVLVVFGVYFAVTGNVPFFNQGSKVFVDDDTVVALVNDQEVYGIDLTLQMKQAAEIAGISDVEEVGEADLAVLRSQSLDAIVNTELIVQAAKDAGIEVTEEDVDAEYALLKDTIGGDSAAEERLATLGTTVEHFKENVARDILIRRYLESTIDQDALLVTDEDVEAVYLQMTGGQTEGVPSLEELRPQLETRILYDKQQQMVVAILETLRDKANIEILI